jgi:putative FmdB family regulatory protein
MPIYEYRCAACGHHLEALQKMAEAPLRKCPECGKSQLRRLVSASQFRLKGSGWYETDFKNKNETKRNLVGAEAAAGPDKGTDPVAKDEAKKEVAAAKSDGEAKPKASVKPSAKGAGTKKSPAKAKAAKSART